MCSTGNPAEKESQSRCIHVDDQKGPRAREATLFLELNWSAGQTMIKEDVLLPALLKPELIVFYFNPHG